jgi:hypothetical protein
MTKFSLFDEHKVSFICKPCSKSFAGEGKRSEFNRHCDSHHHCLAIEHLLKSKTTNKINNEDCYEQRVIGRGVVKIGLLLEEDDIEEDDGLM